MTKQLLEKVERIKKRWEAVEEFSRTWEGRKKAFIQIFGSVGDSVIYSKGNTVGNGKLCREYAVIVEPNKELTGYVYKVIYVLYDKTKVNGLYGCKGMYKLIREESEGSERVLEEMVVSIDELIGCYVENVEVMNY